jgi:hypothetical protein
MNSEAEIRRLWFKASLCKHFPRPHLQNNENKKWPGGVAYAVESPLCKCEALSSNPSPTKTKQKNPTTTHKKKNTKKVHG